MTMATETFIVVCLSDATHLEQAVYFVKSCRLIGYTGEMGVLYLDEESTIPEGLKGELRIQDVILRVFAASEQPAVMRSGIKCWIPLFFDRDYYLLADTDILPLSPTFISRTRSYNDKISLVKEDELRWSPQDKCIGPDHPIVDQLVYQSGTIGFSRRFWEMNAPILFQLIMEDTSTAGDMVAINQFCYTYPERVQYSSPEVCLVLRPTGKGPGTVAHLPHVDWNDGHALYKRRTILALHYTYSKSNIIHSSDYLHLFSKK